MQKQATALDEIGPFPPPERLLGAQQTAIVRLFHALGGGAEWFEARVWPLLRCWASLCGELVSPHAPQQSVLAAVLASAAAAAEARRPIAALDRDPSARLQRAYRAGFQQLHQELAGCEVRAASGRIWDPARHRLEAFQQGSPAPHRVRYLRPVLPAASLCEGAARLVATGVWTLLGKRGRWYLAVDGCAALWPLAGQDLGTVLASSGQPVPPPEHILLSLAAAGFLLGTPEAAVRVVRRSDGRTVRVLVVQPTFARSAGLPLDHPPPGCQRLSDALHAA